MKNFKLLLLLAALAAAAVPAHALGNGEFEISYDASGQRAQNLDLVGIQVSSKNAAGVLQYNNRGYGDADILEFWDTGKGIFYGVEIGTGAATIYVVCMDTNTTGVVPTIGVAQRNQNLLMQACFANVTNSGVCPGGTTLSGGGGRGREYINGLACWKNSAVAQYLPLFRPQ